MKTGVFNLKLSKLKLYNYRCFGDVEQVIDINNITAFIGNRFTSDRDRADGTGNSGNADRRFQYNGTFRKREKQMD